MAVPDHGLPVAVAPEASVRKMIARVHEPPSAPIAGVTLGGGRVEVADEVARVGAGTRLTRIAAATLSLLGLNSTFWHLFQMWCADAGATGPSRTSTSKAVATTAAARADARARGRAVMCFMLGSFV